LYSKSPADVQMRDYVERHAVDPGGISLLPEGLLKGQKDLQARQVSETLCRLTLLWRLGMLQEVLASQGLLVEQENLKACRSVALPEKLLR
jgi:hypothetical protein